LDEGRGRNIERNYIGPFARDFHASPINLQSREFLSSLGFRPELDRGSAQRAATGRL
jgi:hypothetical protein